MIVQYPIHGYIYYSQAPGDRKAGKGLFGSGVGVEETEEAWQMERGCYGERPRESGGWMSFDQIYVVEEPTRAIDGRGGEEISFDYRVIDCPPPSIPPYPLLCSYRAVHQRN